MTNNQSARTKTQVRAEVLSAIGKGVRFSQGGTYVGTMPTLLQRAGDFSQTRNAAGNVIPIYNPATTRANPAGGFLRDQFTARRAIRAQADLLNVGS